MIDQSTLNELAEEFEENALGDVAEYLRENGIPATAVWVGGLIHQARKNPEDRYPGLGQLDLGNLEVAHDRLNTALMEDTRRFTVLDSANEWNKIDEVSRAAGFPCVGIVDEREGGIYIYVAAEVAGEITGDDICAWLNAGHERAQED